MLIHFTLPDFEVLKSNGNGDPYTLTNKMTELIMASIVSRVSNASIDPESGKYELSLSGRLEIPPNKDFWSDWSELGNENVNPESGGQPTP